MHQATIALILEAMADALPDDDIVVHRHGDSLEVQSEIDSIVRTIGLVDNLVPVTAKQHHEALYLNS